MPRNGSGTFERLNNWSADAAAGDPDWIISSSKFDNENNDFASAFTTSIATDGQSTITADIPWASKKITNLADPTGPQDAATQAYVVAGDAALQGSIDAKQPLDATLTSIAALGTAADKYAYTTGVDTWVEGDITAAGRAILDDADAAAQRATIGLPDGTQGEVRYYTSGNLPAALAVGTSGQFLQTQGAGQDPQWANIPTPIAPTQQILTASGTWTKPAGCTSADVTVLGPGGGGGGSSGTNSSIGAGGGAGGLVRKRIDVTAIASATVTVGTGGAAGSATGDGGDGSADSVWSDGTNTLTAGAGDGGPNGAGSGGTTAGGTATGGDINVVGESGSERGSHSFGMHSGEGGSSILGSGGRTGFDAVGAAGTGYGAGGSGGDRNTAASRAGGAGSDGIVIINEFYG